MLMIVLDEMMTGMASPTNMYGITFEAVSTSGRTLQKHSLLSGLQNQGGAFLVPTWFPLDDNSKVNRQCSAVQEAAGHSHLLAEAAQWAKRNSKALKLARYGLKRGAHTRPHPFPSCSVKTIV